MRAVWLAAASAALAAPGVAGEPAAPEFLPTPYAAEQIRDAWRPGLRVDLRTTGADVVSLQRMVVVAATAESCTIRSERLAPSGEADAAPEEFTARWEELRDHARFEASQATRARAECRSALGALPGWRYETTDANGDALAMGFADATPGPPVEREVRRGGKLLSRTEYTLYERPSGAEEER